MANLFNNPAAKLFKDITTIFGHDAEWTPSAGGSVLTGRVTFIEPTNEREQFGDTYNPFVSTIEYYEGTFDGLLESVREGNREIIFVNGVEYVAQEYRGIFAGRIRRLQLQKTS